MFNKKNVKYISVEEMNEHLTWCYDNCYSITEGEKPINKYFRNDAYYKDSMVKFELTYKREGKVVTYVTKKDSSELTQHIDGMEAYRILSLYCKIPDMRDNKDVVNTIPYALDENKFIFSAKPLLYKNPKYEGIENYDCVSYDINSSYSNAMLKPMPDTSVPFRSDYVRRGEIGFRYTATGDFIPMFNGYSSWVFPLIDSPFKKFVDTWYNKKKNAKNKEDKLKAKEVLNYCVGYMQKSNPFLRATIIYYANQEIKKLMDQNTIYCNTDSIVSLKEKNINIGSDIGQFKIENKGTFKFKGFNYQWNLETPHFRGKPKSWFKEGWDILKDEIPHYGNVYYFNKEKYLLEEAIYERI